MTGPVGGGAVPDSIPKLLELQVRSRPQDPAIGAPGGRFYSSSATRGAPRAASCSRRRRASGRGAGLGDRRMGIYERVLAAELGV
jgi:hypothetical protein